MLLEVEEICSGYDGMEILHGISLSVDSGEIVAIIGANGAGKSTTLKTLAGEIPVSKGSIRFANSPVVGGGSHRTAKQGLMLVPEHRALFGTLTVEDNLKMGAWGRGSRAGFSENEILDLFPILGERRSQIAETMSGGQQQMVAIARALMSAPRLLMLDEPSTGLSPKLTWDVFHAVNTIRESGVGVLIVEQNASQVLNLADRAYVLESGAIALSGDASELAEDERVQSAYLGG
jgi:branched-chain amino acid transport system ATP-binding protein